MTTKLKFIWAYDMGNAASQARNDPARRKKTQTVWGWEVRNGRLQPKALAAPAKRKPLFKPRPDNNYDWWIFNPDSRKKS